MGILLTSSRSPLKECVTVTKQPGRLTFVGLSSKTTRVPRLSFLLQMAFPDCRKARLSNRGGKAAAEGIL